VRELLQTGDMHNRVRMIVASFFTKDLLLPWQWGEKFFANYLLDYDAASNILSWQWSAGTGIDPQPYFRIFNPYLQSKKFDKEAVYIKKWVPELEEVEAKYLHNEAYLLATKLQDYPQPMLVHKEAKDEALAYFKQRV
ncbi:MAG TPA: deoxyribodipyrimidine photo-lyase, partial [Epsilonproteobacteria bacterium]|nr:deoxyribodipyrimidine photo-lyase [Campylobacterota bacterium]